MKSFPIIQIINKKCFLYREPLNLFYEEFKKDLNSFVGYSFEEICSQFLIQKNQLILQILVNGGTIKKKLI